MRNRTIDRAIKERRALDRKARRNGGRLTGEQEARRRNLVGRAAKLSYQTIFEEVSQ